jgi:ketosteroid isomerase-like protein
MADRSLATKDEIVALEKSYWDAIKAKDGRRTAKLSGDTALVTGARGVMSIPKAKMGKMTEEGNWTLDSYAFDEVEVSTPAPDVAIIAYTVRQKVTMDGNAQEMRAADSSTWVRGADGWECHAHSETFLTDKSAA